MSDSKWLPIETAPATSYTSQILLAWRHRPVSTGWWDFDESYHERPKGWKSPEEGWRSDGDRCIPVASGWPTHWMPLPIFIEEKFIVDDNGNVGWVIP